MEKVIGIDEFLNSVNSEKVSEIMWDESINRYVKSITKVKKVLNHEKMKDEVNEKVLSKLDTFIEKCSNPEFHIAFVGAIKAGKSTLINALLGVNLASTSVTPETASLTKFRASRDKNYIKINFYNDVEWDMLWKSVENSKSDIFMEEYNSLNADKEKKNWINKSEMKKEFDGLEELKSEIKKWTSSKEATHYFVKEVEVGLNDFKLPDGVIFVDTPGLDDPVQYRSDITRKYIDRANAVLVCVKSDALTGGELGTIYSVFANARYNPEKVYIAATQLDTLNRPIDNWKEQREEWIKILRRDDCYNSTELAKKNIIGVAAYVKNLVREYYNIKNGSDEQWDLESVATKFRIRDIENNLDKLDEISNIENLKIKLREEIIGKYKSLLIEDLTEDYKINKENILSKIGIIKERQKTILQASSESIEEIRKRREESLKEIEECKLEKQEMEKTLKQVQLATTKRAEELFSTINSLWR